jgi:RNA polymerase sigma-70 factor (TIGR02960 family)
MSIELLDRARAGDADAFAALVDPHRTELQVHCYRMLGSLQDAEDARQETLLAAWVGLAGFEGRSSLRTWLYRIATNVCLNALRSASRRPVAAAPGPPPSEPSANGEVPWLQPYPDLLLDGLADEAPGPEARYETREAISLAFVTALQLLPPTQRAVLLLRDVLGYRARESAELLGLSEDAVTSALKRAREALPASRAPGDAPAVAGMPGERALLDRFVAAFTSGDVETLVALFTDDVRVRMPPLPFEYHGPEAAGRFFAAVAAHRTALARMMPVGANLQPAWAEYVRDSVSGRLHLVGVLVAGLSAGRIRELTHFETTVAASFGLPRTLDA